MSEDEPTKTKSSGEPRRLSEIDILQVQLQQQMQELAKVIEDVEKLGARVSWVISLSASKADHILQLAGEIAADRTSRDRQTETVLICIQKLTEIYDQRAEIRAAMDFLASKISTKQAIAEVAKTVGEAQTDAGNKIAEAVADAGKVAGEKIAHVAEEAQAKATEEITAVVHSAQIVAEKKTTKAIKKAVREATGRHAAPNNEEPPDTMSVRVNATGRLIGALDRTRTSTKVLLTIFALLIAAWAGGKLFLELHKLTEEPHGNVGTVERAPRKHHEGEKAPELPPKE